MPTETARILPKETARFFGEMPKETARFFGEKPVEDPPQLTVSPLLNIY
jgi:hypothetical protein